MDATATATVERIDGRDAGPGVPPARLTVDEVARLLGCSSRTVRRLADAGRTPWPVRLGSLIRWPRKIGMTADEIAPALQAINLNRCEPPLDAAEVQRIAVSIGRYDPDTCRQAQVECWPERYLGDGTDWHDPQPLPEDLPSVKPFNPAMLPSTLRPWIVDIAERMQCPPDFPAVTSMVALSGILVRIFDRDLAAASIPKRDERDRVVDIHALRHTFGTHLSKAGVTPRVAMAAMRHSSLDLTMNIYTDPVLLDVGAAVDALPAFSADEAVSLARIEA